MAATDNGVVKALINAAVKLKLRAQIKASFFLAFASPIALTGNWIPRPYADAFFASGSALAVIGVIVLVVFLFSSEK